MSVELPRDAANGGASRFGLVRGGPDNGGSREIDAFSRTSPHAFVRGT